jgi:hypothetical protein
VGIHLVVRPLRRACLATVLGLLALGATNLPGGTGPLAAPTARAADPGPPLTGCLGRGTFDLGDPTCDLWGDTPGIGRVTAVQRVPVERGRPVTLTFDIDFDMERPTRPCGDLACPYNRVAWRFPRFGVGTVAGCGDKDATCTITYDPAAWGDDAERYSVVLAQHMDGIFPVRATAYALYVPPLVYPVRLDPVDVDGRPLALNRGVTAFAVHRVGATESECTPSERFRWPREAIADPPPCVRLVDAGDDVTHERWFAGSLPVDSGPWRIVAGVRGDPSLPIEDRPAMFRPVMVTPMGDDITGSVTMFRRPTLGLRLDVLDTDLALGATTTATLTVSATGGEVGGYEALRFTDRDLLAIDPFLVGDRALRIVAVEERPPLDGFAVANGATRRFELTLRAIAEGPAELLAELRGRSDLGDEAALQATGEVFASFAMPPIRDVGPQPPVMARALDLPGGRLDVIQGQVRGEPGGSLVVSLITASGPTNGGPTACPVTLEGEGITRLGAILVDLGPDGTGLFTARRPVVAGDWIYGYASSSDATSTASACLIITDALAPTPAPDPSPVATDEPDESDGPAADAGELAGRWTMTTQSDAAGAPQVRRTIRFSVDREGLLRATLDNPTGVSRLTGRVDGRKVVIEVEIGGTELTSRFSGRLRTRGGTTEIAGTYRLSNGETGRFTLTRK